MMGKGLMIYILATQAVFFCGCGEGDRSCPDVQPHVESTPTSSVPDDVAMAVVEIEKEFAKIPSVITNWSGGRNAACRIREKIVKLPPALSEQYGRKMAQAILSVPIDHLSYYAQFRTHVAMFHMLSEVGWRNIKAEDNWELRILSLKCLREAIEYAQKEKSDQRKKSHIEYVSADFDWHSEFWEKDLAYRVSKSISPQDYEQETKRVTDKEYFAIRKRFEEFLGRPIRSYEEIVRTRRERERQLELERRRPLDDDVRPDIKGL